MKVLLLILFFIHLPVFANGKVKSGNHEIDLEILEYIRTNYYASVENEDLVEVIEKYIEKNFSADKGKYPNLILAYVAALQSVKSKHAFWPLTKLEYFNESMDLFSRVVSREPNSLEIRFLRFAILHHVPGILGHSAEKQEDANEIFKLLLKKDYSSIKEEIQIGIAEFLVRSERLDPSKEKILKENFVLNLND
ncbi:MAG TPA: hypothetical protein PLZ15_11175 [Melioribacteraceae bacterium]|nr:hypothetical protein [Melioribacteraceae bacterium]